MNIIEHWFEEVWNKRNAALIDEMWVPDKKMHNLVIRDGKHVTTKEEFRNFHELFLTAYPDLHVHIEDVISEGDKSVARLRVTGTHTGPGFTAAPTGKPIDFSGMAMVHERDGKVVEAWNNFDFLTMYRQLE
jgi:predicted ester cyclase